MNEITLTLNYDEYRKLIDPKWTRAKVPGGFQNLMKVLVLRTDRETKQIRLTQIEFEKINRYAFAYKSGGWENGLKAIFSRLLGPKLDRHLIRTSKPQQTDLF